MFNDIYSSFYSEYKSRFSSMRVIVENFLNPLFILFIFGIAMSSFLGDVIVGGKEVPYIVYFLSGSVNIGLITNCVVSATRFFLDKYIGRFDYYISMPIRRSSILFGRLMFHMLLSSLQVICMTLFVTLLYFEYISINMRFLLFLLITITCSIGWFCILFLISFSIRTQDKFNVLYYLIMTPVLYLSSIYYPVEEFILPLRLICYLNPLTWSTDVGRALLLNTYDEYFILKIILIILFAIISYILVNKRLHNWTKSK